LPNELIHARFLRREGWQEIKPRHEFSNSGCNRWMKFILVPTQAPARTGVDHDRVIPSPVKVEVGKTDKGRGIQRGCRENLHFDHIISYSQGGCSRDAAKIQILCARRNLGKKDIIQ
jgi:hypothetical protein